MTVKDLQKVAGSKASIAHRWAKLLWHLGLIGGTATLAGMGISAMGNTKTTTPFIDNQKPKKMDTTPPASGEVSTGGYTILPDGTVVSNSFYHSGK